MLASYKKSLHAAFIVVFCLRWAFTLTRSLWKLWFDRRHGRGPFRRGRCRTRRLKFTTRSAALTARPRPTAPGNSASPMFPSIPTI